MYNDARSTALRILAPVIERESVDIGVEIETAIQKATIIFELNKEEKEKLKEDLFKSLNVTMSIKSVLLNQKDEDHIPWLNVKKSQINWKHWNRYKRYLTEVKKWPVSVINSLDDTTDSIIELLEDPLEKGRGYDRRGLIVGYVQSGKTANYTALINKAIDAGFKLIIVLAGLHNDLRSQTQMRLDEEVLGFETSREQKNLADSHDTAIGVGKLIGENFYEVFSLTSRDQRGDFNAKKAKGISVQPTSTPFLLVVKKNATVLKNLLNYFRNNSPLARKATPDATYKTVPDIPLLIIDDEADQASVNTAEIYKDNNELSEEYDPSKINAYIRQIYQTFEQKAYVGYTATPFANIFINQDASTSQHGQELFPKDFIISLPKPSNYVGPAEFFMLDSEEDEELPLIRSIEYEDSFLPRKHKKNHIPSELPETLIEGIYSFILTVAIRRIRGQVKVHNSMLIHVTRFKDVQHEVFKLVSEEMRSIKNSIKNSKGTGNHFNAVKKFFEKEYANEKLALIRQKFPSHFQVDTNYNATWAEVLKELPKVLDSIKVREINGNSKDALEYSDYKETGLNVIAVGGDKLSRGLTLEGLTVSYYLRASKMYDTLMQMGRWFGYRPNYLDLCRIYTTDDLVLWFQHIAVATEELRGQLEFMAKRRESPQDFLLKIQSHPEMYVTSALKMRSAKEIKVSYSNELVQTTVFPTNSEQFYENNFNAVEKLIELLQQEFKEQSGKDMRIKKAEHHHYWENVDGNAIIEFFDEYQTVSSASRANSKSLAEYVRRRIMEKELRNWTVILINNKNEVKETESNTFQVGGVPVGNGVKRKGIKDYGKDGYTSIKTLTSSDHEFFDFTQEQYTRVEEIRDANKEKLSKTAIAKEARSLRDPDNGLLIIYPIVHEKINSFHKNEKTKPFGFAVSLPESKYAHAEVDYMVNVSIEQDEDYWTELD